MGQGGIIAEGGQAATPTTVRVVHITTAIAASATALMKPGWRNGRNGKGVQGQRPSEP